MDGHDTHEKPDIQRAIYECLDNEDLEIIIFCFPAKTTHKCQPLDVLVFSAVDRRWQEICAEYLEKGKPMNRLTAIPAYVQGTRDLMVKEFLMKAFEKTGIYPVNCQVFTDEDFAPSRASSTIAHVPDSFPTDFPSSDPAEASDDAQSESDMSDGDFLISDEEEGPGGDDVCNETGEGITGAETESEEVAEPASGFMQSLASLETKVVHMTRSVTARLELFKPAPPMSISLEEDRLRSREDLLNELRSVRQQLIATHQALGYAIGQLSASNAHCTAIQRELGTVRERLSNATKAKERGSKKIKAHFVTSRSLRTEFDQEETERQERERATAERDRQKEAEDAKTTRQIADDALNRDFTGRLAAYKKSDLRALTIALSISDKGTNTELSSRIQNCFEQNPDLKRNSRFSGLFNRHIRERNLKPPTNHEEAHPTVPTPGLPHQRYPPHLPHVPNLVPNAMASSSSYIFPTNHYINQYHTPAPIFYPQPTTS
ncbi:hypothetical protein EDB85DRAFT_1891161 [Lactarius pseudohatsudake]|nr:hypothetical protein EDB85DRAFT_1891161 [Lactarius pseudohatsudake]